MASSSKTKRRISIVITFEVEADKVAILCPAVPLIRYNQLPGQVEILDIGRFGHPPRDEQTDDPHAGIGAFQDTRSRAVMRARGEHVIEQPDDLRFRIPQSFVNRVVGFDFLGLGANLLIVSAPMLARCTITSRTSVRGCDRIACSMRTRRSS